MRYVHYLILDEATYLYWDGQKFVVANEAHRYPSLKEAKAAAPRQHGVAILASNSHARIKYWTLLRIKGEWIWKAEDNC